MVKCKLEPHPSGIAVRTPFDRDFIFDLKYAVPSHERRWDGENKVWVVLPKHGATVAALCRRHFGDNPPIPKTNTVLEKKRGILQLLYVGAAKEREDGSRVAFGMDYKTRNWSVVFPENVLRNWFDGTPLEEKTAVVLPTSSYYLILGIKSKIDDQDEIKAAYRRMARQWHPDICKEPDATERFQLINTAYETLSNPQKKKLYDVGQDMVNKTAGSSSAKNRIKYRYRDYDTYKPALRCGAIDCDYEVLMDRAYVTRIYSWSDIVENGRVLVSSWRMGATEPIVAWV
jgi:hypothetical protein